MRLVAIGLALGVGAAQAAGPSLAELCRSARSARGVVRILHFGDSHLAARDGNQPMSQFFHARFGDGGPGLGLPWLSPQPGLDAQASRGWRRVRRPGRDGRTGLAGGFLETSRAGETAGFAGAFARFRLHLLTDPAGGRVRISVDGRPQGEQDLQGAAGQMVVFGRDLPPAQGPHRVELRVERAGLVRILGLATERTGGAVYSPLAFNGARAVWLRAMPEDLFRAQVQAAAPDLVILAFGTNEANARDFDPEGYRQELAAILDRFQRAAPQAALLLVGPPDASLRQGSAASLAAVIAVQKANASRFGATFVDRQRCMGGPGAMAAWFRQGWANADLVHLNAVGYPWLARLTLNELFGGVDLGRPAPATPAPQGGEETRPLYTFRKKDGGLFITDDPAKAEGLEGTWIKGQSD